MTGADGRFQIDDVWNGMGCVAQKPGFTMDQSKQDQSQANAGSHETPLRIALAPLGTLEGTVTDRDGSPLQHVHVQAFHVELRDGRKHVAADRAVSTDDRGRYRFWNLTPGKYYVRAGGSGGTKATLTADLPTLENRSFAPVYYGGGSTLSSAASIQIDAGSKMRADMAVDLQRSFHIRGRLVNAVPYELVTFEVIRRGDIASIENVVLNAATGEFDYTGAMPGTYVFRAKQNSSSDDGTIAEQIVQVGEQNLSGVTLTLGLRATIKVVMHIPEATAGAGDGDAESDLKSSCDVTLFPADEVSSEQPLTSSPPIEADDHEEIADVPSGNYRVAINCRGIYVGSAMSGDVDVASSLLTVMPGVAPAPIEIALRNDGAAIEGSVSGHKASGLAVVLAKPNFSAAGEWPLADVDPQDNEFSFAGLAPGEYTLHLIDNPGELEYRNPDVVAQLTDGVQVTVGAREKKQVTLVEGER